MRAVDALSVEYLEDEERYADLINGVAFEGRQVVRPSDIREKNRVVTRVLKRFGKKKIDKMERDIVRDVKFGTKVVFVAAEEQTNIHYAMPVRVFNEDGAEYLDQWKKIRKRHQAKKDLRGNEFLSGFSKSDRLIPIFTLVLYFGEQEWDGPRRLKDMLDLDGLPESLKNLVADYPLNLVDVRNYPHRDRFRTDLRQVFGFLANASDETALVEYIKTHRECFSDLREDAYDLISEMSGVRQLKELPKKEYRTEGGGMNMFKGLEGMLNTSRREGREEGIQLARKVFLLEKQGKSSEDIVRICNISNEEVERILRD